MWSYQFFCQVVSLSTFFAKKVFDLSGNKVTLFRPWIREISEPYLLHPTFCLSFINGLCYFMIFSQINLRMSQDSPNLILMQTGNFLDSWCVIEVKLGSFDSILVIHFSRDYNIAVKKIWDCFVQMYFFSSPSKKI